MIVGFHVEIDDLSLKDFYGLNSVKHSIKEPPYFTNAETRKAIELKITSISLSFHNSDTLEGRLFDFCKLTVSVLKRKRLKT